MTWRAAASVPGRRAVFLFVFMIYVLFVQKGPGPGNPGIPS